MKQFHQAFWSISVTEMLQQLEAKKEGLTSGEAQKRLELFGSNLLKPKKLELVFAPYILISQPGKYLLIATLSIFTVTFILPYTPLAGIFGFSPPPISFLLLIGLTVLCYIFTAEIVKKVFYKRVKF